MDQDAADEEINLLLDQLNRWVRESGMDPGDPSSRVRSTGESNAAIELLQGRLRSLGAAVRWDEEAGRYDFDATGRAPESQP